MNEQKMAHLSYFNEFISFICLSSLRLIKWLNSNNPSIPRKLFPIMKNANKKIICFTCVHKFKIK